MTNHEETVRKIVAKAKVLGLEESAPRARLFATPDLQILSVKKSTGHYSYLTEKGGDWISGRVKV